MIPRKSQARVRRIQARREALTDRLDRIARKHPGAVIPRPATVCGLRAVLRGLTPEMRATR